MMRTIKPARTVAGRRRQMARLRAEFEELSDADPRPSSSSESALDVAALVARELDRRAAAERDAAEIAEVERIACPRGAGCWRCGMSWSADPDGEPNWTLTANGAECVWCFNDIEFFGRAGDTDDDVRVRQAARLLGLTGLPLRAVGSPHSFRSIKLWFSEHDAEPVSQVALRFSHVDLAELRRSWELISTGPEPPEPEIMTVDEPCDTCGSSERFVSHHVRAIRGTGRGGRIAAEDWNQNAPLAPVPGDCVDCRVKWLAAASGRVPGWWVERRGKRLPRWAKQFTESVPA